MASYSFHARKRMRERSIADRDVEEVLARPQEVILTRNGRKAAYRRIQGSRYIVVIFEQKGEDFIVVTAVKVNRNGAKRYGFTRV